MGIHRRDLIKLAGLGMGSTLLAAPVQVAQSQQSGSIANLQAFLRQRVAWRLNLPPPPVTRPLINWAGPLSKTVPATTLPAGTVYPASSPLLGGPVRHRYAASLPGAPAVAGLPCLQVNRTYVCKGAQKSVSSPTVLRFITDAPIVELSGVVADGSASSVTVMVDGLLLPAHALSSASGGGGWNYGTIRIDFGSRARRDIWLETGLYTALLRLDPLSYLDPVSDINDPQITVIGDSFLQARSGTFGNGGAIALELGLRLGIQRIAIDAVGGTGYRNSGNNTGSLNDRLPAHAPDASAIYLVMAGLNDYGDLTGGTINWGSRVAYENAVNSYLAGLRAARPGALIVVTAPFCPVPPMSDSTYVANPALNNSGLGDFLYKARIQREATQRLSPPWIHIDVLMGRGWINSSGATGDVSNLQWFTGGTPAPGTSPSYRPGNTHGGGGGGFGGISSIPILNGGTYRQAPEIIAYGGTGSGLVLSSMIDAAGRLSAIRINVAGRGYRSGAGLPGISIDRTYEYSPAVLGTPELLTGINPSGMYPLPSFAPSGVNQSELNNIFTLLNRDAVHPSPAGVEYLSSRLARNIHDAILAL